MPVHREFKPPEVLQAQVAAYATEALGRDMRVMESERAYVFDQLGAIAAGPVKEVENDLGARPLAWIPSRPVLLDPKEYGDFLCKEGGQASDVVQKRVELLRAYSDFAPDIDRLTAEVHEVGDITAHPGHIGQGENAHALAFRHEGKEYVAMVPKIKGSERLEINDRISGLIRVQDVPHFEQIVAASYDEAITISERMPGKALNKMTPKEITKVTQKHMDELVQTLIIGAEKKVGIEMLNPGNVMYDRKAGFGLIDLDINRANATAAKRIKGMAGAFMITGLNRIEFSFGGVTKEMEKARLTLLEKLQSSVERTFGPEERKELEAVIKNRMSGILFD
jgi:hypothetical protein